MRLGKSIQILRWLKEKNANLTLIVCPLSVMAVWENELALENIPFIKLRSKQKELIPLIKIFKGVILTNYETLIFSTLAEISWDCVILDESQKIRRQTAKISQKITESFEDVPLKAILTGTPAPENPLDYFQQFKFLNGEMCKESNRWEFRWKFFTPYGTKFIPTLVGINAIKQYLADNAIVVSRKNPAVQSIFNNEKIYSPRYVEMDKKAYDTYAKMELDWAIGISDERELSAKFAIVVQNYLHQMASGFLKNADNFVSDHKLRELETIIVDELDHNDKVVIYAKHRKEIDAICDLLPGCLSITGDVPESERANRIDRWSNPNHKDNILVCQIVTASMGINLSASDTVIYFSNSWSMQDRLQSEDRILSPENHTLLYIDLVTKNTIDEDIMLALENKRKGLNIDFYASVFSNFAKRTWKKQVNLSTTVTPSMPASSLWTLEVAARG